MPFVKSLIFSLIFAVSITANAVCEEHFHIKETASMTDILRLSKSLKGEKWLFLFDFDQTLIQTILAGSIPFQHVMMEWMSREEMWKEQDQIHMSKGTTWPAEQITPDILRQIAEDHYTGLLTLRDKSRVLNVTNWQINQHGFEFSPPSLLASIATMARHYDDKGLLMAGDGSRRKIDVLKEFLSHVLDDIDGIVFVDDSDRQVKEMREFRNLINKPLVVVQYTRASDEIESQTRRTGWRMRAYEEWIDIQRNSNP